ncbi:MAG: tRNA (adenosine(37)-N6)-threonylcarbamoyltransferase complex dimerization subunit type 1 TsaB [Tidjanibacter sp.]|nr:tRNA (adenosine(37)-N6)-threonylcarbamoyltransferase complex dimerization subunit type 1 TsaB [Tidjanibacter sp.]
MGLILCIETGTDICSVALAKDGEMIALRESDLGKDHARKVGVFTQELLQENGIEPDELDAVAVGRGPGSYTGLRIGVSFAKGMCYALGIPLIAIDSLRSLAACLVEEVEAGIVDIEEWDRAVLCPMIDARRMEVYAELFDTNLTPRSEVVAEVVDDKSFSEVLLDFRKLVIFGNGAEKCCGILEWADYVNVAPSARGLCAEAERKLQAGEVEDVAYFEPFYLKDFVVTASKKKLF